jgi:hypothetical protein
MASKKKSNAKVKKPARKTGGSKQVGMHEFFKTIWKKRELLEQFGKGGEHREKVLEKFKMKTEHKEILKNGCVRDVIQELAGVRATSAAMNTVISSIEDVTCGHAECMAFSKATQG